MDRLQEIEHDIAHRAYVQKLEADRDALIAALEKVMQWVNAHPRKATLLRYVIDEANTVLARVQGEKGTP